MAHCEARRQTGNHYLGQSFFEPAFTVWRDAVRTNRPDLRAAFHPWDRISSPDQLRQLLQSSNLTSANVIPEDHDQNLQSPEDWWTIVLGCGLRGTVDAMDVETALRIHDQTVGWIRDNDVTSIKTNRIHAIAEKY